MQTSNFSASRISVPSEGAGRHSTDRPSTATMPGRSCMSWLLRCERLMTEDSTGWGRVCPAPTDEGSREIELAPLDAGDELPPLEPAEGQHRSVRILRVTHQDQVGERRGLDAGASTLTGGPELRRRLVSLEHLELLPAASGAALHLLTGKTFVCDSVRSRVSFLQVSGGCLHGR